MILISKINMKILTLFFLIFSFNLIAQDTLTLNEFTVIGIKTESKYPITQITTNCDSVDFLNQQKDPFFVFDKISPSIYSQSDNGEGNGYSYIRLRGIDQTRINFNLNTIPLNEMEDQGIYFSNIPGFYNYISNISIQRGIGTSKFGITSIGGSVNMESRNMFIKEFRISSSLLDNTFKSNSCNFMFSSGNRSGFAYQFGSSYANNYGFKQHSNNNGGSIFYGVGYHNKKNIVKLIGFSGTSNNQLAFYGVPMDIINIKYDTNLNSVSDKDKFGQNFISLNWINSKIHIINSNLYFNNVNGEYNTAGSLFGINSYQGGISSNILIESKRTIKNIGFNGNLYKRSHFGHDMQGYYYDTARVFSRYTNTGYKNDAAIYFKFTQKFKKINILYDVQVRYVTFDFISNLTESPKYNWLLVNPKIGLKYFSDKNDFYFTVGNTKREPTRTDIIQNIIQNNNLFGANPDNIDVINTFSALNIENVINIELGNNFHTKKYDINSNLYFIKIKNEFVSTGVIDQYSGFMWKIPVDKTYRFGFESEGTVKFNKINTFYNFQYQKSKIDNKQIPFNPNLVISGGISFKSKIEGGIFIQYVGEMAMNYNYNDIQKFSNDFACLNLYLKYEFDNLSFTLNVNNITNNKYYIPAGVIYNTATYYVGQLLNYKLSISYKI